MGRYRRARHSVAMTVCLVVSIVVGVHFVVAVRRDPVVTIASASGKWRIVQEPDAGMADVDAVVGTATRTLDVTMYELQDDAFTSALIDAHRKGVRVRVLLDAAYHGERANAGAWHRLDAAGVAVRWEPTGVIVHQKTITADAGTAGALAVIGTANLQQRYYGNTLDAWIVDRDTPQVAAIAATFDADWDAAPGAIGRAVHARGLLWSPGAESGVLALVTGASRSLRVSSEELSDASVVRAIAARARAGISCQLLMTDQPAWHSAFRVLTSAGCAVHVFPWIDTALYIHEKQLIVDDAALLIGSQNIGPASLRRNRELSVLLSRGNAPAVLDAADTAFAARFAAAEQWS